MANILYLDDAYLKEFDAKVVRAENGKIILDQTAFYPESGGQPCDYGKIIRKSDNAEFSVQDVRKENDEIVHCTNGEFKEGDEIKGVIDWTRRYQLMKMHTASHVIGAVINLQTNANALSVKLDAEKSCIEFDADLDRAAVQDYFTAVNDAVKWDLPVVIHNTTRDVLSQDKKLAKLLKDAPEGNELRVIEVNIFNKQICYGTHVNRTGEIGQINLADTSNKRVYFKLG